MKILLSILGVSIVITITMLYNWRKKHEEI